MLRLINLKVQSNKTITINNPIQLRQGDYNVAKLVINPSLYFTDNYDVIGTISFKRADNKQTGNLLLSKEQGNLFTYPLNDPWLTDIAGELWFTITFDRVIRMDNGIPVVKERLYAGNASLYINPDANYTVGNYIQPTDVENLQLQIDELANNFGNVDANIDSKLNKDFTTYPTLDWETVENTDLVILNRVDSEGNVTQYNAEAKDLYTTINGIMPDDDGNIDLNASDIPYNNTNVETALNDRVKTSDKVVYYEELQDINEPFINVTRADYATGDGEGNNIVNTYATKTELSSEVSTLNSTISSRVSEINGEINTLDGQLSSLESTLDAYNSAITSMINDIVSGTTTVGNATNATNSTNATQINGVSITKNNNNVLLTGTDIISRKKLEIDNLTITSSDQNVVGGYVLPITNYASGKPYQFYISYPYSGSDETYTETYIINYLDKGNGTRYIQNDTYRLTIRTINNNITITLYNSSEYQYIEFTLDKLYSIIE